MKRLCSDTVALHTRVAARKREEQVQRRRDSMQAVQPLLVEQRETNRLHAVWIESVPDAA